MTEKRCTLLFLRTEDQVLLAMKKRGFGEGRYNGVGGKVEADETLHDALVRECQEEIGVTPIDSSLVAEYNFYGDSDSFHMHVYVYMCTKWKGEPTETEEMAPQWYDIESIPYDRMWSDDKLWLPRVLKGEKLTGIFHFDKNDEVTSYTITQVNELQQQESV